jgi:hypothetical protein
MEKGAPRPHIEQRGPDTGPERHFSFGAFQKFLQDSLGFTEKQIKENSAKLFALKDSAKIAQCLIDDFGVKAEVAQEFADLILLEEQTAFLKGPNMKLGDVFFKQNFYRFLTAKTPERIYSILSEHIPSFSEEQLVKMTEATAAVFRLPRARLWQHSMKKDIFPPVKDLADNTLARDAFLFLEKHDRPRPVRPDYPGTQIIAETARASQFSAGDIEADSSDDLEADIREPSVIVDAALIHDEPTNVLGDFHDDRPTQPSLPRQRKARQAA